jgi:serine protease Do
MERLMGRTAPLLALLAFVACSRPSEPDRAPGTGGSSPPVSTQIDLSLATVRVPEVRLPSLAPLVEKVSPAVVSLEVEAVPSEMSPEVQRRTPPGHERFFGRRRGSGAPTERRAGSGFVVAAEGLVLTNNHVVRGARSITVTLQNGQKLEADLVGRDGPTDLALLRLRAPPPDLAVATLGDSSGLKVGDWLLAIGNPFGLSTSVSLGILSATSRDLGAGPYDEFLQTDAAINPGNSGGPLFDMQGRVVGVNTAIVGNAASIGFAVPSSLVRVLLPELERSGGITRGALGVYLQDLTPELAMALSVPGRHGAVVNGFTTGSGARAAGVLADDILVSVDGHPIESARALIRMVGLHRPGDSVQLGLVREGASRTVAIRLGERTDLEGTGPLESPLKALEQRAPVRLGMELGELTPEIIRAVGLRSSGAVVLSVEPNSPADRAGLRPGLVLVEVAGQAVHSAREALALLEEAEARPPVIIRLRGPEALSAVLTIQP